MTNPIRIATRQSKLALWQANFIKAELERAHPELRITLVPMTTRGDREATAKLADIGGKGLFVKELERAMLDGHADIAVHSVKDLPARLPEGFHLAAVGYRADTRDAFISGDGRPLSEFPLGGVVGTSSLRRAVQLRRERPDIDIRPIRGNVDTRLGKLDAGEFQAIVLASAGLERLGLAGRITEYLSEERMLPAAGQGALGIECLESEPALQALLEPLNNPDEAQAVEAERRVCAGLGATCTTPLGVRAHRQNQRLSLRALLALPDGSRIIEASATSTTDDADPAAATAERAVADLFAQGGGELMQQMTEPT